MNLYTEYVACSACGYRKLCRLTNRKYICRACDKKKDEKENETA